MRRTSESLNEYFGYDLLIHQCARTWCWKRRDPQRLVPRIYWRLMIFGCDWCQDVMLCVEIHVTPHAQYRLKWQFDVEHDVWLWLFVLEFFVCILCNYERVMCFCLHCTPDTIISFENYNPGITESGGPWRCAELLPQLHLSLNQANRFDFHLFKDVGAFSTFSFRLFRYRDYCYVHVHMFQILVS